MLEKRGYGEQDSRDCTGVLNVLSECDSGVKRFIRIRINSNQSLLKQ